MAEVRVRLPLGALQTERLHRIAEEQAEVPLVTVTAERSTSLERVEIIRTWESLALFNRNRTRASGARDRRFKSGRPDYCLEEKYR